jgi:tRNA threonylcarbamoyladenosine biosynthesis protein TsaB
MRVLSLDTTTRAGSMALVADGRVVDEQVGDGGRTHAERLPGELLALLTAHGWTLDAIDLFAVASGPGSFTGLRIGIATMQGFAFVRRRPIAGVSALRALGVIGSAGASADEYVGAWIDARRKDVFTSLYRVTASPPFSPGRLEEIEAAAVSDPGSTLRRWSDLTEGKRVVFVGDGARVYARDIAQEGSGRFQALDEVPPLAGTIGCIAAADARAGASTGAGVQPLYVRRPDAEIDRDRRAAATGRSGSDSR